MLELLKRTAADTIIWGKQDPTGHLNPTYIQDRLTGAVDRGTVVMILLMRRAALMDRKMAANGVYQSVLRRKAVE